MFAATSISDEILDLKKQRKAILLAHHYQEPEIQELADVIGDSLELARKARDFEGEVIAFCGVWFMAETAKVLNPDRIVVVPDRGAGCSLVDSCTAEQVRAFRRRHPDYAVVSYINTSAEVKAESDIICTSRNAVSVVNSIPAEKPVLFLPDINLGNYVKKQTGRQNMQIWQGACIVHATFPGRRLAKARAEHPTALVAAHPECPADVLAMAPQTNIGSSTPITSTGDNFGSDLRKKVINDAAAYIGELAREHDRNAEKSEAMVRDAAHAGANRSVDVPMPPAAPCTSTVSPSASLPRVRSAWCTRAARGVG